MVQNHIKLIDFFCLDLIDYSQSYITSQNLKIVSK